MATPASKIKVTVKKPAAKAKTSTKPAAKAKAPAKKPAAKVTTKAKPAAKAKAKVTVKAKAPAKKVAVKAKVAPAKKVAPKAKPAVKVTVKAKSASGKAKETKTKPAGGKKPAAKKASAEPHRGKDGVALLPKKNSTSSFSMKKIPAPKEVREPTAKLAKTAEQVLAAPVNTAGLVNSTTREVQSSASFDSHPAVSPSGSGSTFERITQDGVPQTSSE